MFLLVFVVCACTLIIIGWKIIVSSKQVDQQQVLLNLFFSLIVGSIFFQEISDTVEQSANIIVPVDNIIRYNNDELQSVFCFDVEYLLKMFIFYFFSPQQKLSVIQTLVVLFEVL